MRNITLACAALLASSVGCIHSPEVVPAGGPDQATARAGSATLTVHPSAWDGEPSDLADYVTPVLVSLENAGPAEVRITYFDFQLTDESGFRYAALNPFMPASSEREREEREVPAQRVAWRAGGVHIGAPPPHVGGARVVGPRGYVRPGPVSMYRRGYYSGRGSYYAPRWAGYAPLPYYRPWLGLGFGFGYWNDPFFWPPGYASWVWGWSPAYYPAPTPPTDVVNAGLPEGVLQPGGHVEGYLYFQRTHDSARQLGLTWDAHEARTGAPLGQARVMLQILR